MSAKAIAIVDQWSQPCCDGYVYERTGNKDEVIIYMAYLQPERHIGAAIGVFSHVRHARERFGSCMVASKREFNKGLSVHTREEVQS